MKKSKLVKFVGMFAGAFLCFSCAQSGGGDDYQQDLNSPAGENDKDWMVYPAVTDDGYYFIHQWVNGSNEVVKRKYYAGLKDGKATFDGFKMTTFSSSGRYKWVYEWKLTDEGNLVLKLLEWPDEYYNQERNKECTYINKLTEGICTRCDAENIADGFYDEEAGTLTLYPEKEDNGPGDNGGNGEGSASAEGFENVDWKCVQNNVTWTVNFSNGNVAPKAESGNLTPLSATYTLNGTKLSLTFQGYTGEFTVSVSGNNMTLKADNDYAETFLTTYFHCPDGKFTK